jgi:large subunit ribosomal protein L20
MVRIKTNVYSHKRKKRVLKEAKGQFGDRSKRYKEAIKSLIGSRQYAYFDRKKKKGEYRSLWIIRLNAACRESGITYSRFISGLKSANITLDRKVLADLAVREPEVFAQILEQAKSGKPPKAESKGAEPKVAAPKAAKKTAKKA